MFCLLVAASNKAFLTCSPTDCAMLDRLISLTVSPAGHPICLYGDPAYPLRVHLQAPFRNVNLTPQMMAFNKCMSEVRVSVEWMFGDIANYFKFMDFKKNLKIGSSSVGKLYIVSALLRNALCSVQEMSMCIQLY